ncbi:thioesterase family protein [uncultured Mailhella sp.]|uniref:acyl-CoA thioesterase n=1 Tax=uncultured Mailhella sp. TaxID=1981031 RepID=UPI002632783A|nr:thioesterase family protein [uncultured Mailhella sp.]
MDAMRTETWLAHRVSYGETDAMGVVYHAEYLHYFERSRNALCRACGMSYREIEQSGFALPVREVQCRYRRPARYDDVIQIHVWIAEWRRASIRFQYEILDESRSDVLCEGMTFHAFTSLEGRPVAIPGWIRERLDVKPA